MHGPLHGPLCMGRARIAASGHTQIRAGTAGHTQIWARANQAAPRPAPHPQRGAMLPPCGRRREGSPCPLCYRAQALAPHALRSWVWVFGPDRQLAPLSVSRAPSKTVTNQLEPGVPGMSPMVMDPADDPKSSHSPSSPTPLYPSFLICSTSRRVGQEAEVHEDRGSPLPPHPPPGM